MCHYEGVGHVFLRNRVFISSGPPPLYFLTSPLKSKKCFVPPPPPNIESLMVLPQSQSCSAVPVLTARHSPQPSIQSVAVGSDLIYPSETVKNLGTVFDTTLSLEKQVTAVCKAGFYHLRNIARVRKHLSFESNQVLIHAFVTSKLDYCNSFYHGLPDFLIKKLQYVQNSAARLLTGSCKYDHVTPILRELHWLPVQHRIIFKILTLTY